MLGQASKMVLAKWVLDAGARAQRTGFAGAHRNIASACAAPDFRRDVAMNLPKAENLASWENEGGAIASAPRVVHPVAGQGRGSAKYQSLAENAPRADRGISDTNTLAIMRISLLLLIPAIGGGAIYWGLLIGSASQ